MIGQKAPRKSSGADMLTKEYVDCLIRAALSGAFVLAIEALKGFEILHPYCLMPNSANKLIPI